MGSGTWPGYPDSQPDNAYGESQSTNESTARGHAGQMRKGTGNPSDPSRISTVARRLLRLKLAQIVGASGRVRECATLDHGRENTGVQRGTGSRDQSPH